MKLIFSLKNKSFLVFASVISTFFFASLSGCSDSEPRVIASSSYVIFDYPDVKSEPSVRFAVFLETSSDVHRVSKFTVTSRETSYQWYCDNPVIFSNEKRNFAGWTDFVTPEDIQIPTGFYDVEYVDAQDRICNSVLSVNYQSQFEKVTVEELDSLITGKYRENVALYDNENSVVYYGEMKDSWKTEKRIFSAFGSAVYYRKCIILSSSNTILLFPPVTKDKASDSENNADSKTESLNSSENKLQ